MALNDLRTNQSWTRRHLVIRLAGLTGLLVASVSAFVAYQEQWLTAAGFFTFQLPGAGPLVACLLLLLGGAAALAAVVVELVHVLGQAAGQRSAFGANVAGQVALAALLLLGINLYSFRHYLRIDWTRDSQFTLPDVLRSDLARLEGETTIVVYQAHKTFGKLSDKPDGYDYAAERKVVEKVHDLVDQFRQFGPRFRVVVLDVEEEGYQDKLKSVTRGGPELKAAIEAADENSIFFAHGSRVQRLSFNDFYQLDKTGSQEADGGRGNLVLLDQGVGPFARRVLSLEEKRPRVGIATIHQVLSTESTDERLGMAGLRKALQANGFEVRDILLKKWSQMTGPEPATADFDENNYERLEVQQTSARNRVKQMEEALKDFQAIYQDWKGSSLADLTKKYARELNNKEATERIRQAALEDLEDQIGFYRFQLEGWQEQLDRVNQELTGIKDAERLADQRRLTDLRAKTALLLADCDLLIVPRLTLLDLTQGASISPRFYRMDDAQADAIQDFLKAGKPVLACLGPANEDADDFRMERLGPGGPDAFENLLSQLGVRLGRQTILYNVESSALAESGAGLVVLGASAVEVPPVQFDWERGIGKLPGGRTASEPDLPPHPIREGMRLTSRGVGKDSVLDLRLRHPRPIYYESPSGKSPRYDPNVMLTAREAWNEDQPFPSRGRTPEFRPTKATDPAKGTLDEVRPGPFPIGIAIEEPVPASWYSESNPTPAMVRLAVLGHGGLFTGMELSPPKEKLLLNLCNWLLGRDDRLPTAEHVWDYPRVYLTPQALGLWSYGLWLGPPVLFAYLGLVVLQLRRLR